ncbi:MAG TPA: hypothetical protein VF333_08315 [Pyrinomonadaceae bacterium]
MDIDALHSALLSLTVLTEQIRSARDNVSAATDSGLHAFEEFLNSVERDLLITKATLARELDFPVCQCCWPPELLVIDVNESAYCPGSQKAAATNALSRKPPQRARLLPVISKPRRVDNFKCAQTNKLLQLREEQEVTAFARTAGTKSGGGTQHARSLGGVGAYGRRQLTNGSGVVEVA